MMRGPGGQRGGHPARNPLSDNGPRPTVNLLANASGGSNPPLPTTAPRPEPAAPHGVAAAQCPGDLNPAASLAEPCGPEGNGARGTTGGQHPPLPAVALGEVLLPRPVSGGGESLRPGHGSSVTAEPSQQRETAVTPIACGGRACDVCGGPLPAPTRKGGRAARRHRGECQRKKWRERNTARRAPGEVSRLRARAAALQEKAAGLLRRASELERCR